MYALLQETIDRSNSMSNQPLHHIAGAQTSRRFENDAEDAQRLTGSDERQSEFGFHQGVFAITPEVGDRQLVAINRAVHDTKRLDTDQIASLLPGGKVDVISIDGDDADDQGSPTRELWGMVWLLMIAGLLMEGWLSLGSKPVAATDRRVVP